MAESGIKYETLDARCRACEVKGGEEKPCIPDDWMVAMERETGYACPRREWPSPDSPAVAQLVRLGSRNETGHLFREVFEAYFGEEPRAERQRILRMIFKAYGDEVVAAALWPQRS